MAWSSNFVVHTVYCDGHDTHHEGNDRTEAIDKYTEGLRLAFDPPELRSTKLLTGSDQEPHVRQVTMLVYDEDNNLIHHIDSGVFECADLAPQPA